MRTYYVRVMVNALNKKKIYGHSPVVQWLGLSTLTAEGQGSVPGWETRSHKPLSAVGQKKIFFFSLSSSSLTCSRIDGRRQAGKWLVMMYKLLSGTMGGCTGSYGKSA